MAFPLPNLSAPNRDLFDDSTMSFGDHLEVLRTHLLRGILWLVIGFVVALIFSRDFIIAIQKPVNRAMTDAFAGDKSTIPGQTEPPGLWETLTGYFRPSKPIASDQGQTATQPTPTSTTLSPTSTANPSTVTGSTATTPPRPMSVTPGPIIPGMMVQIDATELANKLHEAIPATYPAPPKNAAQVLINLPVRGTALDDLDKKVMLNQAQARTDNPDEAFMIYMIVSGVMGFVIASPAIFYELWQFVAAGLYPHERRYVYKYLPFSIGLFLMGSLFCFYFVIPVVLKFLFGFNAWLELRPELRIGAWIKFALLVSVLFGLSFQLPLVMLLLERISIFSSKDYREKWRHAILAISIISMVLTPSEPVSMMMMMIPLCILYGLGIWMCEWGRDKDGFDSGASAFSGA